MARNKARTARDALLPGASKAYGRFKLRAKAALFDKPRAYEALFGGRVAIHQPGKRKGKKKSVPNGGTPA